MVIEYGRPRRVLAVGICGTLSVGAIVLCLLARRSPPQLPRDEEVFKTVDALFTAMTSRDTGRLEDCEQRLSAYHATGRMSDAATDFLNSVIDQAHAGDWEPAAHRLYDFMLGQRGE